jgi:hypothetical protein
MATLQLSTIAPDFDQIRTQLENYLGSKDSWKGTLTTQTGQTILELVAAVGALDQEKLIRFYEDAFPTTALNEDAIYAIATMQGLRLTRKLPANLQVTIQTVSGTATIPAYSQFQGGGTFWFNRSALTVTTTPVTVSLWQGLVVDNLLEGTGTDYQMFISPEDAFQVSNVDVLVRINDVPVERSVDGLWKLKGQSGYRDRTLPNGALVVEFGNSNYGSKPQVNDTVRITYVVTSGKSANALPLTNKRISYDLDDNVICTALAPSSDGADEQNATVYKNVAVATFGDFGSSVTKQQYLKTAITYSGVVDALAFSQREINPYALKYMNVVRMTLLTTSTWNNTQKQNFISDLESRTMFSTRIILQDPVPIVSDVSAIVYCYNWTNTTQAVQDATTAVQNLFAPRPGILGFDIKLSDIYDAILGSNKGIEYIELLAPYTNLTASSAPLPTPGYTIIPGGGNIQPGTYYYGISVVTADGEIAPKNWVTVPVEIPNSRVEIEWTPVNGAQSYRVWGRTTANLGLIGTSVGTIYSDSTGNAPSGTLPAETTVPIRYNKLGNVSITAKISTRQSRTL